MTKFDIFLSSRAADTVTAAALQLGITPEHFLTCKIEESFGGDSPPASNSAGFPGRTLTAALADPHTRRLVVSEAFPEYPIRSIELAQIFVDELVTLPGVTAIKRGRGVGLRPRFAQIEYLLSFRGEKPGIVVSVYGEPGQFADPRGLLEPDRKSYSRARIYDAETLRYFLNFARQAHARRYGQAEENV